MADGTGEGLKDPPEYQRKCLYMKAVHCYVYSFFSFQKLSFSPKNIAGRTFFGLLPICAPAIGARIDAPSRHTYMCPVVGAT